MTDLQVSLELILGIIGAISGLVATAIVLITVPYKLGHKLGEIDQILKFMDAKQEGEIKAKVNALWQVFIESKLPKLSKELLETMKALLTTSNPHSQTELIEEILSRAAREFGITISSFEIFREVILMGPEEMVARIDRVSELIPNSDIFAILTIQIEGRRIEMFLRFHINEDMTIEKLQEYVSAIDLLPEEAGMKASDLARRLNVTKLQGYADVVGKLLSVILETLVTIRARP